MATDYTVKIFDQFYNLDLVVNANEYEIVYSYFLENMTRELVAKTFTEVLFSISNNTKIPVLDLLNSFQNSNQTVDTMSITRTMAYYLNSVSNKTLLYGVSERQLPNQTVIRNTTGDNPLPVA